VWLVTTSSSLRARASSRYGRVVLSWLRSLRLDCLRLGVRNETPEAGYYQRPLLCLPVLLLTAVGVVLFQESLKYFEVIGIVLAVISLVH